MTQKAEYNAQPDRQGNGMGKGQISHRNAILLGWSRSGPEERGGVRTWSPGEISRQQQKAPDPDPDLDLIWRTGSLGAICGRLLVEKAFAERGKVCVVCVSRRREPIGRVDDAVDECFHDKHECYRGIVYSYLYAQQHGIILELDYISLAFVK
ncbi:hypothetical protein MKX08_010583 [Trichoderma sp. CBMAI-0020]|nr:hypothetical protein MKX08_010583 [Trichoderma sp. CBMAI-0020]